MVWAKSRNFCRCRTDCDRSIISPFRADCQSVRKLFDTGEFIEVFVDAPLAECERRDVKGLYAKARRGELKNFTGIDSIYEPPESPEIHLQTVEISSEACVDLILHLPRVSHSGAYTNASDGFTLAHGLPSTNIAIEDML